MGQSLFKKHSKFQSFDEIFYCGMTPDSETRIWMFFYNVSILELSQESKISDRVYLRNIQKKHSNI